MNYIFLTTTPCCYVITLHNSLFEVYYRSSQSLCWTNVHNLTLLKFTFVRTAFCVFVFQSKHWQRRSAGLTLCIISSCVPSGRVLPSSCIRGTNEYPNSFFSPLSLAVKQRHMDTLFSPTYTEAGCLKTANSRARYYPGSSACV